MALLPVARAAWENRRSQAVTRTEDIAIGLALAAEPFNNDDLIDLSSGGRCMWTGLPFRKTPVGSG